MRLRAYGREGVLGSWACAWSGLAAKVTCHYDRRTDGGGSVWGHFNVRMAGGRGRAGKEGASVYFTQFARRFRVNVASINDLYQITGLGFFKILIIPRQLYPGL